MRTDDDQLHSARTSMGTEMFQNVANDVLSTYIYEPRVMLAVSVQVVTVTPPPMEAQFIRMLVRLPVPWDI